ncbi:MAG: hypothetical protein V3U89_02455 [Methylophilaceae bacterium]
MPFIGLGLHFLIALFFAVHAMRNGRQMYWIIILFSFPLLGSIVYFFAEYLPSSKVERGVKNVSNKAIQLLDPTRELREARQAFELTPTIQNRMRLAAALDNAGEYAEAASEFDACLEGPFSRDPDVCFGAAKAKLHVSQPQQAIVLLQDLRDRSSEFRPEQLSVLLAQSYAANQDNKNAQKEFVYAYQTFGSAETRAQYALWAANTGDVITAERLKTDLDKDWARWNKHSRTIHRQLFQNLNEAIAKSKGTNH